MPARGGSKGIPRKNLSKVDGLSLIARAAMVVQELPWIDNAIISTDDKEMMEEGLKYGLDAPFLRPEEFSGDDASSVDMWRHALLVSEEHYDKRFDVSVLLEPTSPLRTSNDIEKTVKVLIDQNSMAAATVSPTPAHYTPEKTLMVDEYGIVYFYHRSLIDYSRRQNIPDYYHRNGLCYAVTRYALTDKGIIIDEGCKAVIIERPVVNIDDEFELKLANWLTKGYKNRNE